MRIINRLTAFDLSILSVLQNAEGPVGQLEIFKRLNQHGKACRRTSLNNMIIKLELRGCIACSNADNPTKRGTMRLSAFNYRITDTGKTMLSKEPVTLLEWQNVLLLNTTEDQL